MSVWVDRQGGPVVPAVERQVRELVAEGATDEQIGRAIAGSARLAKRVRHALGLLRAPSPADLVSDATLRALHAEGLTNPAIAERSGLTVRTVQEHLSRLGLPSHRAPGRPVGTGLPPEERRGRVLQLRLTQAEYDRVVGEAEEAGVTVSELARQRVLGAG